MSFKGLEKKAREIRKELRGLSSDDGPVAIAETVRKARALLPLLQSEKSALSAPLAVIITGVENKARAVAENDDRKAVV